MSVAVQFESVTKRYGSHTALDTFTLSTTEGEIFALVGRNDAGKSTAIRILLGLAQATSGSVTLQNGAQPARIGYLPDGPAQYEWMSARSYLELSAGLAGMPLDEQSREIDKLLAFAHLGNGRVKIAEYSLEERVRLGLAHALAGNPDLLVLDEPTSALDPVGRHEVLDMIASIRGRATILMCTHILEDAVYVADTLGIMDSGRLKATGSKRELWERANLPREIMVQVTAGIERVMADLANEPWVERVEASGDSMTVLTHDYSDAWERIPQIVLANNVGLRRLELSEPSYDDVFIRLVGGAE